MSKTDRELVIVSSEWLGNLVTAYSNDVKAGAGQRACGCVQGDTYSCDCRTDGGYAGCTCLHGDGYSCGCKQDGGFACHQSFKDLSQ